MTPKQIKKEILFLKSFSLLKSNPSKAGLMVLFDILFFAIIFYILPISNAYISHNFITPDKFASSSILIVFIVFSLIYYLAILFVYSFFKYCVLGFIRSLFDKTDFSFKRLGQFYSLNIIITGIFFAAMLLLSFILANAREIYRPFVFAVLAIPYMLFLYVMLNASHSSFYSGLSIKESVREGFKTTFTRVEVYKRIILIMILTALILLLLFLGSGYLIRLASKNYTLYLGIYTYFKQASIIIFDLAVYMFILINRVSFYSMSKDTK
ncbi:hypothetical protein HYW20_07675 [Candidatus Woesearchaeota archaeon]|nr:hypothetical protein [Candidatus Woesearchaeota archaeon]